MLSKKEFNLLEKIDQLHLINKTIKESGKTVIEVCDLFGLAHNTISQRFKKMGYTFDRNLKKYVLNEKLIQKIKKPIKLETQIATEPPKEEETIIVPVIIKKPVIEEIGPIEAPQVEIYLKTLK